MMKGPVVLCLVMIARGRGLPLLLPQMSGGQGGSAGKAGGEGAAGVSWQHSPQHSHLPVVSCEWSEGCRHRF